MVSDTLVAVVVTLGRREQSPADGCWCGNANADVAFKPRSAVTKLRQRRRCLVLRFLCQDATADFERRQSALNASAILDW